MKLNELPIMRLPQEKRLKLASFEDCFRRMHETGKMVFSFAATADWTVTDDDKREFVERYSPIGKCFEVKAVDPRHTIMGLEVEIGIWDAFEMFKTYTDFNDEFRDFNVRFNFNGPFIIAVSRKFKALLTLRANSDQHQWMIPDQATQRGEAFSTYSPEYSIAQTVLGHWDKYKVWTPKSLACTLPEAELESWIWSDNKSPKSYGIAFDRGRNSTSYEPFTYKSYSTHCSFEIAFPVVASREELGMVAPFFELKAIDEHVDDCVKRVNAALKLKREAESRVESVLLDFDISKAYTA